MLPPPVPPPPVLPPPVLPPGTTIGVGSSAVILTFTVVLLFPLASVVTSIFISIFLVDVVSGSYIILPDASKVNVNIFVSLSKLHPIAASFSVNITVVLSFFNIKSVISVLDK